MSSPANFTIKNTTNNAITTRVTRDHWVEDDGSTVNNKTIPAGEEKTFKVVAKTGHDGQLDINLVDGSNQLIGQFKIKNIKDPDNTNALEAQSFRNCIHMSAVGYRHSDSDKNLRRINLTIDNRASMTSCWDLVYASQIGLINKQIKSIFKPISYMTLNISVPELLISNTDRQDVAKVRVYIEGGIENLIAVKGNCDFTVNLYNIQGSIKGKTGNLHVFELQFMGNVFEKVDLLNTEITNPFGVKLPSKEETELMILETVNKAFQSIEPISFDFSFALPIPIDGSIVKLGFVNNSAVPDKSFLSFMLGLKADGIYKLSKDVIANTENCNTAFVFSNLVIMTYLQKVLTQALIDNDLYIGDDFLQLDVESYPLILESVRDSEEFEQKCDIKVKIDKGGLISQFVNRDGGSALKIEVGIRYRTLLKLSWHTFPASLFINFSAQDKKLKLEFSEEIGNCNLLHADAIVCPKVKAAVKKAINQFNELFGDGLLIPIPNLSVYQVAAPSYIQVSGKID